jgi:hypothetical protein
MTNGHAYCEQCSWSVYEENDDERSRAMLDHAIESDHDVTAVDSRPIGNAGDRGRR